MNRRLLITIAPHVVRGAFVLALFVLWDLLKGRREERQPPSAVWTRVVVLALCWYLLVVADSVTSLICAAMGSALLLGKGAAGVAIQCLNLMLGVPEGTGLPLNKFHQHNLAG